MTPATIIALFLFAVLGAFLGAYDADRTNKTDTDPTAKPIKHDGRRMAYRFGIAIAVALAFGVDWSALPLSVAFAAMISIGVRYGFNTTRKTKATACGRLHWCYVTPKVWYDRQFMKVTGMDLDPFRGEPDFGELYQDSVFFQAEVQRAGRLAYIVELTTALALVGLAIWMNA